VTSSEDSSCRIWKIEVGCNPQLVKELKGGHTLAVTSVDWKKMADGKEYFVSCSDDRTVRVYDPEDDKFELKYILDTKFITDWHTLTYMSLEEGGEHLAVVSENGYLFIWNLLEKKLIYSRKIHGGSIESLTWREDCLICCSSDCCFSTIKFKYQDEDLAKI
jgi:WD40 repeat protein